MESIEGLAGLVLCGGKSRRMGTDKALMPFEGEPLVLRVARRVGLAASPVLLAPGIRGRLGDLAYDEVEDRVEDSGALGGLVAGLAASPHPLLAVVAVDMPFVSPELLGLLARVIGEDDAAIPTTTRGLEPLHAVYSVRALPPLQAALDAGQLGLREVVAERLRLRVLPESEWRAADAGGGFAFNLNRPADLGVSGDERYGSRKPPQRGRNDERPGERRTGAGDPHHGADG